ncbi:hypothetical protein [Falsiroseomonas sp. CW058]|uniref:hypothetical protein n=1 Tax=Falsiroseomonas sp. CW058 TaxID=3388664 RepID=UPI003D314A45
MDDVADLILQVRGLQSRLDAAEATIEGLRARLSGAEAAGELVIQAVETLTDLIEAGPISPPVGVSWGGHQVSPCARGAE